MLDTKLIKKYNLSEKSILSNLHISEHCVSQYLYCTLLNSKATWLFVLICLD